MIVGMGHRKCGPVDAGVVAAPNRLQHIFSGQASRSLVTQDEGILQEIDDVRFSLEWLDS
jgi:hypothetical protein